MPAFLTDIGFDANVGTWSISIIGFCNIFGAYLSGIWSGRLLKRHVLVFIYLGRAVAITLSVSLPNFIYAELWTFEAGKYTGHPKDLKFAFCLLFVENGLAKTFRIKETIADLSGYYESIVRV